MIHVVVSAALLVPVGLHLKIVCCSALSGREFTAGKVLAGSLCCATATTSYTTTIKYTQIKDICSASCNAGTPYVLNTYTKFIGLMYFLVTKKGPILCKPKRRHMKERRYGKIVDFSFRDIGG